MSDLRHVLWASLISNSPDSLMEEHGNMPWMWYHTFYWCNKSNSALRILFSFIPPAPQVWNARGRMSASTRKGQSVIVNHVLSKSYAAFLTPPPPPSPTLLPLWAHQPFSEYPFQRKKKNKTEWCSHEGGRDGWIQKHAAFIFLSEAWKNSCKEEKLIESLSHNKRWERLRETNFMLWSFNIF